MLKKSTGRTQKQLVAENEDLRVRLDEAEETLRAIRSGEVDALIVSGVGGVEQVFTLTGADHSYRIMIEDMNEGVLTMTAEGVIMYANQRFAGMLRTPLEKVIGSKIHAWVAPVKETASIKNILKESSYFMLRGSKSGCEFSITEDLWPAEVDIGQISQVINNIVINANQAMPKGGTIQVAAENLIIEGELGLPVKPGRYIRVSIKDQGAGIAEKHLANIFDPYFTTKPEGSGLGLATTYSIVKKHDGHIAVESRLGVGTTFHIYLPASEKAVPKKEEASLIKGRGRILVMDDESSLREMIGMMLVMLGYEPELAKNGAEAIQMVKEAKETEKPYDAVILDLTIPGGMGGKDAIKKLLEIDPEVKAIVSSGYSNDPVLSNFQEYGFKGMLPKPFESLSLGKVLHRVINGEKE